MIVSVLLSVCLTQAIAGKQPNIILLLTDDQDIMLGGIEHMPHLKEYIIDRGATMDQHMVNTPICCPSRTTLLSGRHYHNNKMSSSDGGCMHMNTSMDDNPHFERFTFARELQEQGYLTGYFGKYLNAMQKICTGKQEAPNWTRYQAMCQVNYYNAQWVNNTRLYTTGSNPEDYTTSLIGNYTVEWLKTFVEDSDHAPFFAAMGPHAPHLPSTPPVWYKDHWPSGLEAMRTETYNFSALDHHWLLKQQPILNNADAAGIDVEYTNRLRTLLAVDDVIKGVADYLISVGEWDNTYFFYTSDHGYSLGQFRIPSHKTQVYDHNLRVPMFVKGPGISPNSSLSAPTSMVDLAPTFIDLAGGHIPGIMDGQSFAGMLTGQVNMSAARRFVLVEYESIRPVPQIDDTDDVIGMGVGSDDVILAKPKKNKHFHDCANNTFRAIRMNDGNANWLYAEFTDYTKNWDFEDQGIYFYEYYDLNSDPYEKTNLYYTLNDSYKEELHSELQRLWQCEGSDCNDTKL